MQASSNCNWHGKALCLWWRMQSALTAHDVPECCHKRLELGHQLLAILHGSKPFSWLRYFLILLCSLLFTSLKKFQLLSHAVWVWVSNLKMTIWLPLISRYLETGGAQCKRNLDQIKLFYCICVGSWGLKNGQVQLLQHAPAVTQLGLKW